MDANKDWEQQTGSQQVPQQIPQQQIPQQQFQPGFVQNTPTSVVPTTLTQYTNWPMSNPQSFNPLNSYYAPWMHQQYFQQPNMLNSE